MTAEEILAEFAEVGVMSPERREALRALLARVEAVRAIEVPAYGMAKDGNRYWEGYGDGVKKAQGIAALDAALSTAQDASPEGA